MRISELYFFCNMNKFQQDLKKNLFIDTFKCMVKFDDVNDIHISFAL